MIDAEGKLSLASPASGLIYYGVVTDIPGANAFSLRNLAGLGANKFADVRAPYWAFVLRDAGGAAAAPQGEMQAITVYATATGSFTTNAFTAAVAVGDEILILHPRLAEVAAISTNVSTLTSRSARELCFKDQWCATPIASLAIPAVAADLALADVVFPANFLPAGATINCVQMMMKWRKQVDSSGAPNAINGASHTWRIKKAAGAWGTDDVIGIMLADNQMATAASATEGGDIIIGSYDVDSEVDDTNGVTYNFRGDQTNRADAPHVDAASLTLYDVYTGLRVYYTL